MTSIHHVNFIVRDLEAALPAWETLLGQPVSSRDELPARGAKIARFRLANAWLVLIEPTRPDTPPGRHLAEHGEGFFLLSFGVDSLDAEQQRLGEDWFAGPPRTGLDGWQVRDLDPARTAGAQCQLSEVP